MSIRRLAIAASQEEASERFYLNTGGPTDILGGKFVPKADGGWALSGGLGATTAVIAKANRYKSALLNGATINCFARFPESEYFLDDTEGSTIDKNRLVGMSDLYLDEPEKRAAHLIDLKSRLQIIDDTVPRGESLDAFVDFMKEVKEEKVKHAKDLTVETELLDHETGQPHHMLLPTFMGIDSWTEAMVRQMNVKNDAFNADTEMKEQRTMHMEEGWQKARLMRQLRSICVKGGIYLGITGHLGAKISMDGKPQTKDLAFLGQDEAVKSMGNKFYFLMSQIYKNGNCAPLYQKDDRNASRYPSATSVGVTDLQEVPVTLIRSKNAPAGAQGILVSSQRQGVQTSLSYYHYLTTIAKYFGLNSSGKVRSAFLDNLDLGRTKIFELSKDYKVSRALELTYQLCVIQSTWSLQGQPVDYTVSPEALVAKINESSYLMDDILNSRGWWTYKDAPGIDRPYLSLPDILAMLDGNYKPKYFPVKA